MAPGHLPSPNCRSARWTVRSHASSEVVAFLKSGPVWPKTSSPMDNELSLWCELVVDNFNPNRCVGFTEAHVDRPLGDRQELFARSPARYQECIDPPHTGLCFRVLPRVRSPRTPLLSWAFTASGNTGQHERKRLQPALGAGGREFESPLPDQLVPLCCRHRLGVAYRGSSR